MVGMQHQGGRLGQGSFIVGQVDPVGSANFDQ